MHRFDTSEPEQQATATTRRLKLLAGGQVQKHGVRGMLSLCNLWGSENDDLELSIENETKKIIHSYMTVPIGFRSGRRFRKVSASKAKVNCGLARFLRRRYAMPRADMLWPECRARSNMTARFNGINMKSNRNNIHIAILRFAATTLAGILLAGNSFAKQPNVVFILADDLGWADTTLYGHTKFYKTPNIQRLAKRGMKFTHAYSASPLCSPTRSAILTGLSPARTGITAPNCHLPEVVLRADTKSRKAGPKAKVVMPTSVTRLSTNYPNLAKTLKKEGYATGHFGKWHLGPAPYSALQHGFDVDLPHHSGPGPAGSFVAPWKFKDFDHDPNIPDQHIEDRMALEATAWIEKNRDRPFFLNYWMFSVHAPFDAKKKLIEKYRTQADPTSAQRSPTYAAMVESMDDAVGTLLDTLDRLGLSDNTIIIFTADNGGNMYNTVDETTPTSNAPLRGGKATMYEGGTRVPAVVIMPGVTGNESLSDYPIQSEDYYPTLLEALGIVPPKGQKFDGMSFLDALKGKSFDRDAIFQYFPHGPKVPDNLPPAVSVHLGKWKLIRIFHDGDQGEHRRVLYDLENDIGETTDLSSQHPDKVAQLDTRIDQFLKETGAVLPIRSENYAAGTE
jgi:arylsulfatase A-like enzyme